MNISKIVLNYFYHLGIEAKKKRLLLAYKFLEKNPDAYYLDCGPEDCSTTAKISRKIKTKHVYAVEISDKYRNLCRKKYPSIVIKKGDLNKKIPYKNHMFDCITALQVIEHLSDTDVFLEEIFRVLKPSGYVILSTENLAAWHNIIALILGKQPSSGPHISYKYKVGFHPLQKLHNSKRKIDNIYNNHIKIMTRNTLIQLVKFHGFIIEEIASCNYYPFRGVLSDIISIIDPSHALNVVMKLRKKK